MYEELKKHLFIVIGYEHYTPLGAIRSLGENKIKPIVIMKRNSYRVASLSKYIKKLHFVNSYEEAYQILMTQYSNLEEKPFLIPCDDNITELLDKKYDEWKDHFFSSNARSAGRLVQFMFKDELCALAKRHGLNIAKTWKVQNGEIPSDIIFPIITKPITSYPGWKSDYHICHNVEELYKAYSTIKADVLLLQQYIYKENELCLDGVSVKDGNEVFISIASTYTYTLPDYYSMEMVVKNFDDEKLLLSLKEMFKEIQYSGIFSIEFMIDDQNQLWFLEINFRNST